MTKAILITMLAISLTSCELIVIGTKKREPVIDIAQTSAIGAVYLFKTELDSNNVPAATQVLARPDGSYYLAIEQYYQYFEIARIGRLLRQEPITRLKADTLSEDNVKVSVEFNYLKNFTFTTSRIDSNWYIVSYEGS